MVNLIILIFFKFKIFYVINLWGIMCNLDIYSMYLYVYVCKEVKDWLFLCL